MKTLEEAVRDGIARSFAAAVARRTASTPEDVARADREAADARAETDAIMALAVDAALEESGITVPGRPQA